LELGIWNFEAGEKNKDEPASQPDSSIINSFIMFLGNLAGLL
jgi:hypothetical protein